MAVSVLLRAVSRKVARRLVIKHLSPEDLVDLDRPGDAVAIMLTTLEEEFEDDWTLVSHTFAFYDTGAERLAGILSLIFERPY